MQKEYKYLVWTATVTLGLLSFYLLVLTDKTSNSATTTNTISFTGQGKVLTKPDVAVIDLSILTQAATSKTAQDENSRKSASLVDFLKKEGVADKDIKTTGYNIYPQYSYPRPLPMGVDQSYPVPDYYPSSPKITGYQVNQTIQVKVRDLEKVDTVLDGVVSAGVNQVNNLQLTVDEPEKLKEQAREQAIREAKNKARDLQSTLGIRLGNIVNFVENTGGWPVPMYLKAEGMGGDMGGVGGGPSIPTGENEISVSVTITYQIR